MGFISQAISSKPHAVCIPFPAQGHVNPMLKLAKLLHHKGFHITFVNTEFNHRRLIKSRGPDSVKGLPHFQFKTIPDGLPPSGDIDATQDIPSLCESISKHSLVPFRDLVFNINEDPSLPPVSCIVSDGVMSFTLTAAQELGIPQVLFWTTSACGFMAYLQYPRLIQQGLIPLPDSYLETPVDWIPGVKDIRFRDLPNFIRTADVKDIMITYTIEQLERASKASAIVFNTFEELEHDVLNAIRPNLPPVYTIGSLHVLVKQVSDQSLDAIGSNLWKEEPECLGWLDTKKPNSVVYVNFGSITVMTPEQMIEFAWGGLADSKYSFLWVVRPDIVSGDTAVLTSQFMRDTDDTGLFVSWCPQELVLNHPSIGGFLTHSGWNSTLESVCSGVPMICWPFFADQQINSRYSCVHWGIGMEIDTNVKRDEVESLVRELMDGEKGKKMKVNAVEWKMKAEEAATVGGSSYENLDKLVIEILITN